MALFQSLQAQVRIQMAVLCASTILCMGCRISKVGKDQSDTQNGSDAGAVVSKPIVQPQQQVGSFAQSLPVTLDDAGKVKEKLSLRLDYFAASKPGGVTVPSCYDGLASHLVIGRLICAANGDVAMDVQANQIDQVCHTDTASPTVAATAGLALAGCKGGATLQVYKFEPQIKIDSQAP